MGKICMFDFNKYLMKDEKIIWQGRPNPGKGAKVDSVSGYIFVFVFMLLVQVLLIWSVITGTGDGANGVDLTFILFFSITLFFQGTIIWNAVYNTFIKPKIIADDYYCLTNKRALKYESKTNKLVYGYLIDYEDTGMINVKGGYGDVFLQKRVKESGNDQEDITKLCETVLNHDPTSMPYIKFESIKSPKTVLSLVNKARSGLKKNNEVTR